MRMPGIDGIQLLQQVKERYPNIIRVMLTGTADVQTAIDAINTGEVFRFLSKPTTTKTLSDTIEAALEQVRLIEAESRLLRETLTGTVNLLYDLMASINPEGHKRGVWLRDAVRELAQSIDVLRGRWDIEVAALLSQIGAISLPPNLTDHHLSGIDEQHEDSISQYKIIETGSDLVGRIPYLGQ